MGAELQLLLVENPKFALRIERELRRQGLTPHTRRVDNRDDLLAALADGGWDLVLSASSLPGFDGLAACDLAHERDPDLPFIFVSDPIEVERVVEAMRRGVRDCLRNDRLEPLVQVIQRELGDAVPRRQRRAAEEALRTSEKRLRRLVQNAPDIIYEFALEPEPHYAYISPAATEVTGYTPEEHYSDPALWLGIVHDDEREILRSLLQPGRDSPPDGQLMRWCHRDGRQRWVEQRTAPIRIATAYWPRINADRR